MVDIQEDPRVRSELGEPLTQRGREDALHPWAGDSGAPVAEEDIPVVVHAPEV